MPKKIVTRTGDIFSVKIDENSVKYFQYIANDSAQLNSDVIRVFKKLYPFKDKPDLEDITSSPVEFYAHTGVSAGVKLGLWQQAGKSSNIGGLKSFSFRDTPDYGSASWEDPLKVSEKWYVWRIGHEQKFVGKLEGENRDAEIGIIVNPKGIINRIRSGKYTFVYPGY